MGYEPQTAEALDAAMVASRDLARVTRAQFEGFVEAGFTDAQALHLTSVWLTGNIGAQS